MNRVTSVKYTGLVSFEHRMQIFVKILILEMRAFVYITFCCESLNPSILQSLCLYVGYSAYPSGSSSSVVSRDTSYVHPNVPWPIVVF